MKQTLFFLLLLLAAASGIRAQEQLKVKSFTRLERDLLARTQERLDLNDVPCAVVRISVQKASSFDFEGNIIGEPVYDTGEAIVWMASGSRNITLKSDEFGVLRFEFPQRLEKSTVYELSLLVEKLITEQGLLLGYTPANARVYIDDSLQVEARNGSLSTVLPIGQHTYRVECNHYQSETGLLHIVPERLTALNVSLNPTYAFLEVTSNRDETEILVGDSLVGLAPYSSDTIPAGTYTVRARREWYLPQERTLDLAPTELGEVDFRLKRQKFNTFLLAQYGMELGDATEKINSYGFMFGMCRKGGVYLGMKMKDPVFQRCHGYMYSGARYDNEVYSKQTLGQTSHSFSVKAGFMVRLATPLYLYGGSGYTFSHVNEEFHYTFASGDYDESYYYNEGLGKQSLARDGILADLGFVFRYRFLAFSLGYTHAFPIHSDFYNRAFNEVSFGIGFAFGRWGNK